MTTQPCHHCGYDLAGIAKGGDTLCPECGKTSPPGNAAAPSPIKRARIVIGSLAIADVLLCFGLSYGTNDGWAQMGVQLFVAPAFGALVGLIAFVTRLTIGLRHPTQGHNRIDAFGRACVWGVFVGFGTAFLGAIAARIAAGLNPGHGS